MIGWIDAASRQAELDRKAVSAVWAKVTVQLVERIVAGEWVELLGAGWLGRVEHPEKTVEHPLTGQTLTLPARSTVELVPSIGLFCAANPTWSEEQAAEHLAPSQPQRASAVLPLLDQACRRAELDTETVEDALLDALVEALLAAVSEHRETVLVLDGLGTLLLDHLAGFIAHGEAGPVVHRGRNELRLEAGLALRAGL